MQKWNEIKFVFESLYYLSGIVIAGVACLGLKQLNIAKRSIRQTAEQARLSAKREAFKLAAEQCQRYFAHVIPKLNESDDVISGQHANRLLNAFKVEVDEKAIKVAPPVDFKPEDMAALLKSNEVMRAIVSAANELEGFSVLFVSGVAAEKVAFSSVGQHFVARFARLHLLYYPWQGPPTSKTC